MSSQIAYDTSSPFGCWTWTGKVDRDGYPVVWRGRSASKGHRVVYEREVGPIAPGLALDHLCRNRACVAPHHLEPVDQSENERRKSWRYRARRTTCKAGHELASTKVVTPNGGVVCRWCNDEARR